MDEILVSFRYPYNEKPFAVVIRKEGKHRASIFTKNGEWLDASGIHTIEDDEKLNIDPNFLPKKL